MENTYNTMYTGPTYIGTPYQLVQLVYDTGSDWLVVEAKNCGNCLNHTYNEGLSSSHTRVDGDYIEHVYGSATLHGYDAKDRVSLDSASLLKVDSFEFFEIYAQAGLAINLDGILGLSRAWHEEGVYSTGPLFIEGLFNSSQITEKKFSFYMTKKSLGDSYVDVGFQDNSVM